MLFGTYYMPRDRLPQQDGTASPVPSGRIGQMLFPFPPRPMRAVAAGRRRPDRTRCNLSARVSCLLSRRLMRIEQRSDALMAGIFAAGADNPACVAENGPGAGS